MPGLEPRALGCPDAAPLCPGWMSYGSGPAEELTWRGGPRAWQPRRDGKRWPPCWTE